jgi:hypothetical protein
MSAIRTFVKFIKNQPSSSAGSTSAPPSGSQAPSKNPQPSPPDKKPAPTDDSGLRADTAFVSPDGGKTDEAFPAPDVEYDFCTFIANTKKLPSGPFFVRFTLSGDLSWEKDVPQDDGLKAGDSFLAVVHYDDKFAVDNDCSLVACVYSKAEPDAPIHCGGEFGFVVKKWKID